MLSTPDLSHLTPEDYETVYEPAEDTFILLDALEKDMEILKEGPPLICLEIGSGSGCVSTFLASILGRSNCLYLCTDINPRAASCAYRTGLQNNILLDPLNASFADPLLRRLSESIDILIFNPPYVPTESLEVLQAQQERNISSAWAGGIDGMEVTNKFLPMVADLLSSGGRFYLVGVAPNKVSEIISQMSKQYSLGCEVVLQRRAGREHLHVLKFTRI
ncbi:S-adenosyl-L-methionine-dependent methyltransferase [Cantharellus anzutake]|uniref:S-adenosyl-L-methionine-dependent methyltransferase n=1 Tax=Cantharellus anzutake TaxID=1750568 RepID=UPI001905F6B6|nr:S-adenosyl-L-methionine-dependent methyltransferase [Cantharellus anzutake]KAF8342884.1 S-adenosyl-L-methionine-dependent methyltransferase [Cantharellus anzutake]